MGCHVLAFSSSVRCLYQVATCILSSLGLEQPLEGKVEAFYWILAKRTVLVGVAFDPVKYGENGGVEKNVWLRMSTKI